MAYLSKDLSVLAYANGFTLWHYVTKNLVDNLNSILNDGYFNSAADMLREADIIITNAGDTSCMLLVTEVTKTTVTVRKMS